MIAGKWGKQVPLQFILNEIWRIRLSGRVRQLTNSSRFRRLSRRSDDPFSDPLSHCRKADFPIFHILLVLTPATQPTLSNADRRFILDGRWIDKSAASNCRGDICRAEINSICLSVDIFFFGRKAKIWLTTCRHVPIRNTYVRSI